MHRYDLLNYYEYGENIFADGEEQDIYILGIDRPIKRMVGRVEAVIKRNDDTENKWIVVPYDKINAAVMFGKNADLKFSKEEIYDAVRFQEQYFDIEIIIRGKFI